MKRVLSIASLLVVAATLQAGTVYDQPLSGTGTLHTSSWVPPNGTDSDMWVWDNFTLPQATSVNEVHWMGGYSYGAPYGKVTDFYITFYPSIAGGWQPDVLHPGQKFHVNSNASETFYGSFGGTSIYSYKFTLPQMFNAAANTKYWVQIEASQPGGYPDWGLADGAGGDRQHFRFSYGAAMYTMMSGDTAFSLYTPSGNTFQILGSASPSQAGTVSGGGAYPVGTNVTMTAKPNTGYSFVNWTENGLQVSKQASYAFTASANRTLVANLVPTISSLKLQPTTIYGGKSGVGTVTLAAPAIVDVAVNVTSSSPVMAGVSNPVWIPAGSTTGTFTITTMPIGNDCYADITATLGPVKKVSKLLVKAPVVTKITLKPATLVGGTSSTITVTLSSPAPNPCTAVVLSSSDPSVTFPNIYLYVNAGQTTGTATLNTSKVAAQVLATIGATTNGVTKSATLTINP